MTQCVIFILDFRGAASTGPGCFTAVLTDVDVVNKMRVKLTRIETNTGAGTVSQEFCKIGHKTRI